MIVVTTYGAISLPLVRSLVVVAEPAWALRAGPGDFLPEYKSISSSEDLKDILIDRGGTVSYL